MRQNAAAMSASVCIRAYAGPSRSSLSSVADHAGPLPRLAGAGGRRRPRGPDPAGDILAVKAVLIAAGHTPDPYRGGAYPVGASFFTPASRPCLNLRDHSEGRLARFALLATAPTRDVEYVKLSSSTTWRRSAGVSTRSRGAQGPGPVAALTAEGPGPAAAADRDAAPMDPARLASAAP